MTVLNKGDSDNLTTEVRELAHSKGLDLIIRDYEICIYLREKSWALFSVNDYLGKDVEAEAEKFIRDY